MTTSGWERLNCPYFFQVASRTLGDYFQSQGFAIAETVIGGTMFTRWGIYVEISYVPETCPNYAITVTVGFGDGKYDQGGSPTGVPAWYVLQDAPVIAKDSLWCFNSESNLEKVLRQLEAEVLGPYMEELWARTEVLEEAVQRFKREAPWKEKA